MQRRFVCGIILVEVMQRFHHIKFFWKENITRGYMCVKIFESELIFQKIFGRKVICEKRFNREIEC